jgi:transposase
MIDTEQLLTLLGLSDIAIEEVKLTPDKTLVIRVKSVKEGGQCHQCGRPIDQYHGLGQEIQLRHLPIFGYKTFILLRPKRYRCPQCDHKPTTTQTLDWYTPKSPYTKAYEQAVLLALINSTVHDVSLKYDLGYGAVEGILDRHLQPTVDWSSMKSLEVIGVDEIALKKGHRDFVAVVSGYVGGVLTILGVIADRTKAAIKKFSQYSQAVTKIGPGHLFGLVSRLHPGRQSGVRPTGGGDCGSVSRRQTLSGGFGCLA